jgi:hypothetical protein
VNELTVFDPVLCCSSGVCGPEVDEDLVRFAADLEWIRTRGVSVRRYNLAREAGAFAGNAVVREALQCEGTDCLPLVLVTGEIVARGRYPSRNELLGWSGDSPLSPKAHDVDEEKQSLDGGSCCAPSRVSLGGSSNCC